MLAGVGLAMFAGFGCETSAPKKPVASAPTVATDVERSASTVTTKAEIDGLMTELAAVLKRRIDLGNALLKSPEAFTRADADRTSRSYYEEARIVARIESIVETSPEWLQTVCKSFELRVQRLEIRELDLWSDIRNDPACGPSTAMRIFGDEYTVQEREWGRDLYMSISTRGLGAFYDDHPERRDRDDHLVVASDLATLCLRTGSIEESFEAYLGEPM